jgi:hypothetical protein
MEFFGLPIFQSWAEIVQIIVLPIGLWLAIWDLRVDLEDYKADNGIQYKEDKNDDVT